MWARLCLVVVLAVWGAGVRAEDKPPVFTPERREAVGAGLDARPSLVETYRMCPADVWRREQPFWRFLLGKSDVAYQYCEKEPEACADQCFRWHSGEHCFALAQAFQYDGGKAPTGRYTEMLYAMACAMGDRGGCVNRAAGIRNGGYAEDPFAGKDKAVKETCEYRSFRTGCEAGDAWGCAMLGQSYGNGEGVARDAGEARRNYEKACEIAPEFVACDFAKKGLRALEEGSGRD